MSNDAELVAVIRYPSFWYITILRPTISFRISGLHMGCQDFLHLGLVHTSFLRILLGAYSTVD